MWVDCVKKPIPRSRGYSGKLTKETKRVFLFVLVGLSKRIIYDKLLIATGSSSSVLLI
ncbi:MAG: hypothetical protein Nk1A_9090 [Endomicrobiia bacterium]|nr:MAG: hypothetical protein Nk1A_9090 [Endomicrobiia bacterium]